jgi:hypothetical protein
MGRRVGRLRKRCLLREASQEHTSIVIENSLKSNLVSVHQNQTHEEPDINDSWIINTWSHLVTPDPKLYSYLRFLYAFYSERREALECNEYTCLFIYLDVNF